MVVNIICNKEKIDMINYEDANLLRRIKADFGLDKKAMDLIQKGCSDGRKKADRWIFREDAEEAVKNFSKNTNSSFWKKVFKIIYGQEQDPSDNSFDEPDDQIINSPSMSQTESSSDEEVDE